MRSDLLVFFEPAVACDIVRFRQITVSQEAFLTVRQDALRPLGRPFIAKGPEIVGGCRSGLLDSHEHLRSAGVLLQQRRDEYWQRRAQGIKLNLCQWVSGFSLRPVDEVQTISCSLSRCARASSCC